MQVDEYIAKLKYICSEPDNDKREEVSKQLLSDISSADFLNTVKTVFAMGTIEAGIKVVTGHLMKQFVRDNVKKMTFEDSTKLIDLVMTIICSSSTNIEAKDELAGCFKLLITRANSNLD